MTSWYLDLTRFYFSVPYALRIERKEQNNHKKKIEKKILPTYLP